LIILLPVVVGVAAGYLAGGSVANWQRFSVRWPWLIAITVVVRFAVVLPPLNRVEAARFVYLAFLVVLLGWTLLHVGRLPGVWLVSLGTALNLLVIVANGARMPLAASPSGRLAGAGHIGQYVFMDSSTTLNWLGDWILVPGWYGGVFSPGDVVVGLGVGIVSFLVTWRSAPGPKPDATSGRIGS
jgi:Family of unknown function (DUF5317)